MSSLIEACALEIKMEHLSNIIHTLLSWSERDVLNKAGASYKGRSESYDFILDQLRILERIEPHHLFHS